MAGAADATRRSSTQEDILNWYDAYDIILWPVALDFKYHHIEAMKDDEIALSIINGSVRNSEHEEIAHLLRKKSQLVVAFGACACLGGTPGMANLTTQRRHLPVGLHRLPRRSSIRTERRRRHSRRRMVFNDLTLPDFYTQVSPLNHVIDVDYYLPGCPPPPDRIRDMARRPSAVTLPPKGSTLAPDRALCDVCERNKTKPETMAISQIKRIHEIEADFTTCFLAQGDRLHGTGNARRLRRGLYQDQHAVPGLLRPRGRALQIGRQVSCPPLHP